MSDNIKYMVTGASGQLGALVIDSLLETLPASEIGALVRREEAAAPLRAKGITVRLASYDDETALSEAFKGVDRLLLISSSEVGKRAAQHANVISAAKSAGVGFIAYTSLLRADTSPLTFLAEEHVATEKTLKASGLHYSVLRNGWYTENYVMGAATAIEHGALLGAAGDGRISSATREDYARAAATILSGDLPEDNAVYELAGDDAYTLAEFAAAISEFSGKPVTYSSLSQDDYKATLEQVGLPAPIADMLSNSDAGAAKGGLFSEDNTLSRLIGRPTTPWKETLKAALA